MPKQDEENRILRVWTPFLLRTILIVAMILLIAGLILDYTFAPDYFVQPLSPGAAGPSHRPGNLSPGCRREFAPAIRTRC